jgi:hypothetical protein
MRSTDSTVESRMRLYFVRDALTRSPSDQGNRILIPLHQAF